MSSLSAQGSSTDQAEECRGKCEATDPEAGATVAAALRSSAEAGKEAEPKVNLAGDSTQLEKLPTDN